jgi:hypothetical protein
VHGQVAPENLDGYDLNEIPRPHVPLERIVRASRQPIVDGMWLVIATTYILDLLDYIDTLEMENENENDVDR